MEVLAEQFNALERDFTRLSDAFDNDLRNASAVVNESHSQCYHLLKCEQQRLVEYVQANTLLKDGHLRLHDEIHRLNKELEGTYRHLELSRRSKPKLETLLNRKSPKDDSLHAKDDRLIHPLHRNQSVLRRGLRRLGIRSSSRS